MQTLVPVTREEKYLHAIATGEAADITPVTGEEHFLAAIASGETPNREPKTRKEYFLNECANGAGGGGGDYSPASVTIRPVEPVSGAPTFLVNGVIVQDGVADAGSVAAETSTIEVTSLTNSAMFFTDADSYEFTAVSGAEHIEGLVPVFLITGDAVITYREV